MDIQVGEQIALWFSFRLMCLEQIPTGDMKL